MSKSEPGAFSSLPLSLSLTLGLTQFLLHKMYSIEGRITIPPFFKYSLGRYFSTNYRINLTQG